jgi:broad specificity phosphatase PhoE
MTMASRRIFLARHGNRRDFVDPAWSASAEEPYDPPLSADGVEQARSLGLRLAGEGIANIIASPFLRTIETAHHVNESLNVPMFIEPGFGEFLHFSSFDRLPRLRQLEALRADYPTLGEGYVAEWVQRYPETDAQLIKRTQGALASLLGKLPGTLLVVSHAAAVCAMVRIDPAVTSVECPLCALFCLDYDGSRWTLSLDCEVSHVGARLATYRYP